MILMPLKLRRNGFEYNQLHRSEKKAIYSQTVAPNLTYFEVFKIRIRPEGIFKGKIILTREVFPGNEQFGITAWTFRSLEKAMVKFNSLPK